MQKKSPRTIRTTRRTLTRPKIKQLTGEQQFEQASGTVLHSLASLALWVQWAQEEAA